MYPIVRFAYQSWRARRLGALGLFETHETSLICWPWDLDPWWELNNGRTLTLFDLGRMPMMLRWGVAPVMRKKRWGVTVAGSSIRYRRRVVAFERLTMRSRLVGWDDRFMYMEQCLIKSGGEVASHALLRTAVTSAQGIVRPSELADVLGIDPQSPPLADWITAWSGADAGRPWPPMQDH